MTTKPQLKLGSHLVSGLTAVALFVVVTVVFLNMSFPNPQGLLEGTNIAANIGYPMFNLELGSADGESMLVAFEIIDLVLIAALAGVVFLACHEDTTGQIRTILTDSGREFKRTLFDDEKGDS